MCPRAAQTLHMKSRPHLQCGTWYVLLYSGSSLDINFFYFFIFPSYMLVFIYLMTFLRKEKKYPIKWGKLVHGEVREFFLQKLIFAVFGFFRP
jgi:hypothetical protein